jgi:hypothetical protein
VRNVEMKYVRLSTRMNLEGCEEIRRRRWLISGLIIECCLGWRPFVDCFALAMNIEKLTSKILIIQLLIIYRCCQRPTF